MKYLHSVEYGIYFVPNPGLFIIIHIFQLPCDGFLEIPPVIKDLIPD